MLADSPLTPAGGPTLDTTLSPTSGPLEAVAEEDEGDGGLAYIANALDFKRPPQDTRMSATELGMESPPDTPLQEKKVTSVNVAPPPPAPVFVTRGKVFFPEPAAAAKRPLSAVDKGKGRTTEQAARGRSSGVSEKENSSVKGRVTKISPANVAPVVRKAAPTQGKPVFRAPAPAATSNVTSRPRPTVKPGPPVASGGPRRVLVTSADAPPIVKGRRG